VEVRSLQGGEESPIVVLDAGSGIRLLGQYLMQHGEAQRPVHVFLSHRHMDHVLGLAHFAPLFGRERAIQICCGDSEHESVPGFVSSLVAPPMFPQVAGLAQAIETCDWPDGNRIDVGALFVSRHPARHPGEAAVFLVHDATGPLVAYAPDNELGYDDPSPAVSAWRSGLAQALHGVPVLVHDATYHADELPERRGWGHSSSAEAVRFAMECEAGTLVLFHHHPDRDDEAVERLVEAAREQVLRAGGTVRVLAAWEGLGMGV
jgi:ribonuclease BN (tRNA processing enzyme)